jgi:hypothetical protein
MMNGRKVISPLALMVLIAVLAFPVHGQSGIIVNNADTVRQEGVSMDTGLSSVTSNVGPRHHPAILQHHAPGCPSRAAGRAANPLG